jgi:hypothetical protein
MNKIQIINNALIFLGQPPISSIDENSETARVILSQWESCILEMFDSAAWDFGYRVSPLALTEPQIKDLNYHFSYAKPPMCMLLSAVGAVEHIKHFNRNADESLKDFREVHRDGRDIVFSNVPKAWAYYYERTDDTTAYPIDFANALSYLLASRIATIITEDFNKMSIAQTLYAGYRGQAMAKSLNRQNNYTKPLRLSKYLRGRGCRF